MQSSRRPPGRGALRPPPIHFDTSRPGKNSDHGAGAARDCHNCHAIWTPPEGNADSSCAGGWSSRRFPAASRAASAFQECRAAKAERGIWQRETRAPVLRECECMCRHCEEPLRRSNPSLECAARWIASLTLAMTLLQRDYYLTVCVVWHQSARRAPAARAHDSKKRWARREMRLCTSPPYALATGFRGYDGG
jgi:hypothetical protein